MFSVIIATHDSERPLVHTLSALVPGATTGLVREVIVADGQSTDETEQVADYAGCMFLSSAEPLGGRLKAAAQRARGDWLMFLRAGAVPGPTWIDETIAFVQQTPPGAAVFSAEKRGFVSWIGRAFATLPGAEQGLVIPKPLYAQLGGHQGDVGDPEADLLRRIGRSGLKALRTIVTHADI